MAASRVHIERMSDADCAEVSELLRACFGWLADRERFTDRQRSFLLDERSAERTVREESQTRPHLVARAEEGGASVIAGMAAIRGNELARLYVHPRFHRQGVGRALFDAAEAMIRQAGHDEMTAAALVDSAAAFYRTMGMRVTGRQAYEPDIFLGREVVLFAKKLA